MALQVLQHHIDPTTVSPLEYQILQEYAKLASLLTGLLDQIYKLKKLNSQQLLDNLRILETKLSLVFTLFKGSVYSLFLQSKMNVDSGDAAGSDEVELDKEDTFSSIDSTY